MAVVLGKAPVPGLWTTVWQPKWPISVLVALGLGLILILWFGMAWWKVVAAAVPAAGLALVLPMSGLAVMIPSAAGAVGLSAITATDKGEAGCWFAATWAFAKQVLPLLLLGVLASGFLLGRVGHEGVVPSRYVQMLVGASPDPFLSMTGLAGGGAEALIRALWSLWTSLFVSALAAVMHFATLTGMVFGTFAG